MGENEIKFDTKNYRTHSDKNKNLILKSLKKCGAGRSILIDKEGEIIAGNGVYEQAKTLNIPVKVIETDGTELIAIKRTDLATKSKKRKELALFDNSASDAVEWDLSNLKADFDLSQLPEYGLNLEEFVIPEEEKEIVEDEVPEEVETRCKRGDVWKLGEHRLMCGDSTKVGDVEKLMNGEKADMVFTDPPYGMKKEKDGVLNDNLNFEDLLEFNKQWIPLTFANTKENGSWYCWGIDEPLMDIYSNILKPMQKQKQIAFRNLITWDKGSGQGQLSEEFRMYPIADEKCLFVMLGTQIADGILDASETLGVYLKYMTEELHKSGLTEKDLNEICGYKSIAQHWTLNRDGSQKQPRLIQKEDYLKIQKYCQENNIDAFKKEYDEIKKEYDEIKKEYDEIKKEWYETRAYFNNTHDNMNNVWHFPKTSQEERKQTGGHATPKPIALCSRAIKSSSRENETVLDVFGGSGSTLIACEQLHRKCYMCEIDPHYCDVIIQRWENLTGKKAELLK